MAFPFKVHTITLSTAGTQATATPLEEYVPFAIQMSTAITGTTLSFQVSQDESNYFNMFSSTGGEVTVTVAASRYVVITDPERFIGIKSLKVRAGTSTGTSTQAAARTLYLITRAL